MSYSLNIVKPRSKKKKAMNNAIVGNNLLINKNILEGNCIIHSFFFYF